ncbi:BTB/POZ domain-containing protein Btb2 [Schizosaccharomyces japonicus yFS275]|uniref:BTB/POZ domain-containing protein Btb2 n=1 Tax=Schizosaccharomyces japonicus (strain yFS275 / FY16936) TaxID=402676 RepID=B6JW84_SCHJY|nr:BTB/POZ domain-containing protein Btb2 [Schizosaccharomyces japonicus yFS275]EEB05635.1 BTB/POZ domain-containing protein Btb2 [Schizosaccharomyces japonicus yFS275]
MAAGNAKDTISLQDFVFQTAFLQGTFSDTLLIVKGEQYRLHALFLARSPVLLQKISQQEKREPPYRIELETDDMYVTKDCLTFVLSTLYTDNLEIPTGLDARSLLACSSLLGVNWVAQQAISILRASLMPTVLGDMIAFLDPKSEGLERLEVGMYPPYTVGLFHDVVRVLYSTLVKNWNNQYAHILCTLPFPVIKQILESDKLTVDTSSMARYKLASQIVQMRAAWRKQNRVDLNVEESVVLVFSGGVRGIEVIHKTRGADSRRKTLWKASAP